MQQSENNLLPNIEIPVPKLTVDGWADAAPGGGSVEEKGVTIRWELPEGVDAMMVEVDGASWGPYTDRKKTLTIAYTDDPDRRDAEDPVKVRLNYVKFGEVLELDVLPIADDINLILDDIIILRNGLGSSQNDFCPANKYPTPLTPVFTAFGYWEAKYSDKYSGSGEYRAARIRIVKDATIVSCVIRPDTGEDDKDEMLTKDVCDTDLEGNFTDQVGGDGQKFIETTDFAGTTVQIKSFRDTDQDEVVIRIFGIDASYTVGVRLHENS